MDNKINNENPDTNTPLNNKKKNTKQLKNIEALYNKLSYLTIHLDFLFQNKFFNQETYIERVNILNDIYTKINQLELLFLKKKSNKILIENLIEEINISQQKICTLIGNKNCLNTLNIYLQFNDFYENQSDEYHNLFNLYNQYFIPVSVKIISKDIEALIKNENLTGTKLIHITKLLEQSKNNPLVEILNGASILFFINTQVFCINGYFMNDSINIFKTYPTFKEKLNNINEESEYIDIPSEFKEKYIEQLSLRDFLINNSTKIIEMVKNDYTEFLGYKNKSLSVIIKEFIKTTIEKQRKIILLFLLSDEESQFTAHIIFDLIADKTFLGDFHNLSEILFNSLHWKIQKIFKISNIDFEKKKVKLENISINNVPYESRILLLNTTENIKAKGTEKLKEINGSKEGSIKAQQWLDGFLKIPFNIYKKEPIIEFFKNFKIKIDNYINIFTVKISDFNTDKLVSKNKIIYDDITQIIDEYFSISIKSENSINIFIDYLKKIKINIQSNINIIKQPLESDKKTNDTVIDENIINNCMNKLTYFKKIKNELCSTNIVNKNNITTMIKKLNELESMLNINNEDITSEHDIDHNLIFIKYIQKNLEDIDQFVKEWDNFKLNKKNYMKEVDKILDKCTYGQRDAKTQMKRIIAQWMNGNTKGQCFGLQGPPGVGKTTLCKNGFAKCLFDENKESRPFAFLPLGGATNGSILEGHHYTYLGSTWGKIVDILMETKCMNPIIYIDELDKISKTEHGREIISILTHITDASQNKEFYDRYFSSIPIDISNVLFIFSYNDRDSIDRILRDRIQEIEIKPLSLKEKLVVSKDYTIPDILTNVGFAMDEIIFDDAILSKIINQYTYEAGVRKLNEILYDIIREINLKKIINQEDDENKLITYPLNINEDNISDILSNMHKINTKKINDIPKVGYCNGLFATTAGLGGLTIIQVMKTNSEKKFTIEKLTGSQGDVMKESMSCAMTLAWNIIPDNIKTQINESKEGYGLHIHCPDTATSKDGPSAGLCITMGIISRLINIAVRNDIALTGETDLVGNAMPIGGLYSKLLGALNAGIKKVLIPYENKTDLDLIIKKEIEENHIITEVEFDYNYKKIVFRDSMEIILVHTIFEVLEYGLVENDIVFNKIF